jgi:hypothetical protein
MRVLERTGLPHLVKHFLGGSLSIFLARLRCRGEHMRRINQIKRSYLSVRVDYFVEELANCFLESPMILYVHETFVPRHYKGETSYTHLGIVWAVIALV